MWLHMIHDNIVKLGLSVEMGYSKHGSLVLTKNRPQNRFDTKPSVEKYAGEDAS